MRAPVPFSIIIPSWNNLEYLKKCIAGIRQHSDASHQIIVHANEGIDGTVEWLAQEGIEFTHTIENVGICHGVNAAFRLTRHELVMYMNDDMFPLPGWDKFLAMAIPETGDLWMLSSTMIEPRESGNRCVTVADYGRDIASFREKDLTKDLNSLKRSDWHGASWPPVLLPKKLWEEAGGFSVEYSPGMYSDPDLSMKLWNCGVRYFRGVGESLVYHFQSRSTGRVVPNNGRLTFMKKWGISPSFFYNRYLKMGQEWAGAFSPSFIPEGEWFNRLRVRVQTCFAS